MVVATTEGAFAEDVRSDFLKQLEQLLGDKDLALKSSFNSEKEFYELKIRVPVNPATLHTVNRLVAISVDSAL